MKYYRRLCLPLFLLMMLLIGCSNDAPSTTPVIIAPASSPTGAQATPVISQQSLPKGLLKSSYPVMDWVFNVTCDKSVASYSASPMNTTIAYDSAAWLFPSDGHLVQGFQNCDNQALLSQARNQGLPTLLTVGIDGSWPTQTVAEYIDRASSQAAEPCNAQSTTYICLIVNWAVSGGYKGVIIDFELVKEDYPSIAQKFATFMQKLQDALHKQGLLCGTTLIPKLSDNAAQDPYHNIDTFEDWKLLSNMDFLVDMVLDFDMAQNHPGPLVSDSWAGKALAYLWQTIPQALSKTIFEFPLYGREWRQDTNGKWHPVVEDTCSQVHTQQVSQNLLPNISSDPSAPSIAWNDANGNRHELWYNTTASLMEVMTRMQAQARTLLNNPQYRLPTSFWYRGAECPDFFGSGNALETFYSNG